MDLLELQTLADELGEDSAIAATAFGLAARRFEERSPAGYDSSAHHLARCYNVIAQMALRVATAFENAVGDEKGWHTELIRRLSIRISDVRPALFPEELRQPLHELKAFRHVFVHAYDLELDPSVDWLLAPLRDAERPCATPSAATSPRSSKTGPNGRRPSSPASSP